MEVDALNAFGTQLLARWREQHPDESIVFSPLSIVGAFVLLFPGSRGVTKAELDAVFGFKSKRVAEVLGSVDLGGDSGVEWANRVYVEQTLPIEKDFVESVGASHFEKADFAGDSSAAANAINEWVSEKTRGCIPTVVDDLSPGTPMVVVNALHFKRCWRNPFPRQSTKDDSFHGVHGRETVPFMQLKPTCLGYCSCTDLDGVMIDLRYRNCPLSMIIFLPNKQDGWKLTESLAPSYCKRAIEEGTLRDTLIHSFKMPKWELDLSLDNLKQTLVQLGLKSVFSPQTCDFSGITKAGALWVAEVVQKCKIVVNEMGTEASALPVLRGGAEPPKHPLVVNVDRPFLYFIVDTNKNVILFQGTQTSFGRNS